MIKMLHERVTDKILASAVAVHKAIGPGLAEQSYQAAMAIVYDAGSDLPASNRHACRTVDQLQCGGDGIWNQAHRQIEVP
jgi:hypothetical protein